MMHDAFIVYLVSCILYRALIRIYLSGIVCTIFMDESQGVNPSGLLKPLC